MSLAVSLGAQRIRINVVKEDYTAETAEAVLVKSEWLPQNAEAFDAFLQTPLGVALSKRLRSVTAAVAINGSRNVEHTTHAAGVSCGWDEAVRYLHSLSRVSRAPETTNDNPPGETDLVEHLSP